MTSRYLPVLSYGTPQDQPSSTSHPLPVGHIAAEPALDEKDTGSATSSARKAPSEKRTEAAAAPQSKQLAQPGKSRPAAKPPRNGRKPQQPTEPKPQQEDLRRRAVYQAMEKLLDSEVENEAELLRLVKPFSGLEFLQAAEERALAGVCGNAICRHRLVSSGPGKLGMLAYRGQAKPMDVMFCSAECELAVRRLAGKLGAAETAMARFVDAEAVAAKAAPDTTKAAPTSASLAPSAATKPKQPKYAAGGAKTPIMLSEIKERNPDAEASATLPAAERSGGETTAVEGYVPKARGHTPGSAGPRVSWAPSEKLHASTRKAAVTSSAEIPSRAGDSVMGAQQYSRAESQQDTARPSIDLLSASRDSGAGSPTAGASEAVINGHRRDNHIPPPGTTGDIEELAQRVDDVLEHSDQGARLDGQGQGELNRDSSSAKSGICEGASGNRENGQVGQQPVLVFEVEDPDSVLDGAEADLQPRFGRLGIATVEDMGLDPEDLASIATPAEAFSNDRGLAADIDAWKQYSGAGRPLDVVQHPGIVEAAEKPAIAPSGDPEAEEAEAAFVEPDVQQLAPAGDEDEEDDADFQKGSEWLGEPEEGYAVSLSGFGRVAMALEGLVTDQTLHYIQGHSYSAASMSNPIAEEVLKGLQRIVGRTLPSVMRGLSTQTPRSLLELHLDRLLRTFNTTQPIQSLQEDMWQLLIAILLKSLSLNVLNSLQPFFEGHIAAGRLEKYLNGLGFDIDQFEALLNIVLEDV